MRNQLMTTALAGMLAIGAASVALAQSPSQPQESQGQEGHGRGMDPDRQLEHMTKQLNLTSDQQTQIKPILVDRQQKMQALFQNQSLSREDRHSQMMAIRQDSESKINAVLNDDQKQKYQAMQERMREHRGGEQGGDAGAPASNPQPQ